LVNGNGLSIHHVVNSERFPPVAFIFDERDSGMVNRWCVTASQPPYNLAGVNPMLNRICVKLE
jgi:hypothetical protein